MCIANFFYILLRNALLQPLVLFTSIRLMIWTQSNAVDYTLGLNLMQSLSLNQGSHLHLYAHYSITYRGAILMSLRDFFSKLPFVFNYLLLKMIVAGSTTHVGWYYIVCLSLLVCYLVNLSWSNPFTAWAPNAQKLFAQVELWGESNTTVCLNVLLSDAAHPP